VCSTADRCVSGICTGFLPPHDRDCDGYADSIEEAVGCDPNDFYVIPTQAIHFSGSRKLKTPAEAMVTWMSPRNKDVWVDSDPACDTAGLCGTNGFCERGQVGDPCTVDEDCSLPTQTCRLVVNFGSVGGMDYRTATRKGAVRRIVKLRREFVDHLFPIRPACAVKVDLPLPDFGRKPKIPLRMVILGNMDGRTRRDRDTIIFRK
jgi:hypothetical protein